MKHIVIVDIMAVKLTLNIFFSFILLSNMKIVYKCNADLCNCGTVIRSSCPDKETLHWNRRNVGKNLKMWFESIEKVLSVKKADLEYYNTFTRKRVVQDEETKVIKYISNLDCANGKEYGPIWKTGGEGRSDNQFHDGFLYRMNGKYGNCTGDNVVFIYPDMKLALIGYFENGNMKESRTSKIMAERCNQGIKEIKLTMPQDVAPTFKYNPPSRIRIGDQPRVMDPYDQKYVYIQDGKKDDGVFAKRMIFQGDLICYYSGVVLNSTEFPLWSSNMTDDHRWAIHRNAINHSGPLKINVPEQYWNISNYRATLGHKVNHSFKYKKAKYGVAYHPRFGEICSVVAESDINKGEEIFVNYGYPSWAKVPEWYSTLYKEETGDTW